MKRREERQSGERIEGEKTWRRIVIHSLWSINGLIKKFKCVTDGQSIL